MKNSFKLVPVAFAALATFGLVGKAVRSEPDKRSDDRRMAEVRAVLDAQVAAWNRGDIRGFMEGYEQSDNITFISGDQKTRGWQTVLERYQRAYDTRDKMGTLSFSDLEFKPLGSSNMMVNGRFQLVRASDAPHGRFTLLFQRASKGWRVVHDHTSSAPTQS